MTKRKYLDIFEFGNRPFEGRIEYAKRPHTGEFWALNDYRGVVEITTVDPCGRWFNYERVDVFDNEIKTGQFGVNDINDGAYKVEFNTEEGQMRCDCGKCKLCVNYVDPDDGCSGCFTATKKLPCRIHGCTEWCARHVAGFRTLESLRKAYPKGWVGS